MHNTAALLDVSSQIAHVTDERDFAFLLFFLRRRLTKAVRATSNDAFTNKKRSASRKATRSSGPNMVVKRRRATSMTGNNKRPPTSRQAAHLRSNAAALPKAAGGQLARPVQLDATRRAALRPQISCSDNVTVQPARFELKAIAGG